MSGLADDVGQRTPGGCGWGGRDRGLHQRSRLLPPFAAAPRVPAAPAAGNAPAWDRAPTRRLDAWSVVRSRAGRAFQGRGGSPASPGGGPGAAFPAPLSRPDRGPVEGRAGAGALPVWCSPGLSSLALFQRLSVGEAGLLTLYALFLRSHTPPGWKALEKSFLLLFVF